MEPYLKVVKKHRRPINFFISLPKLILMGVIKLYQLTFSFDHGLMGKLMPGVRVCIYYPSCSEYSYDAIDKYGALKGGIMATKRVISCNPTSKGGYDPVP